MTTYQTERLRVGHEAKAKALFAVMAKAFEEERAALRDAYVARLLVRDDMWIVAATTGTGSCRWTDGARASDDAVGVD